LRGHARNHNLRLAELAQGVIDGTVLDLLRARRRAQLEERIKAGPAWIENGLVFTTEIGTPIDPRNYRRGFAKATADAELGHWHPHELRHSTVSLLSAAGVPLEEISDMVGHRNSRVTAVVYRHKVSPTVGVGKAPMERMFGSSRLRAPQASNS
jgi:integrase